MKTISWKLGKITSDSHPKQKPASQGQNSRIHHPVNLLGRVTYIRKNQMPLAAKTHQCSSCLLGAGLQHGLTQDFQPAGDLKQALTTWAVVRSSSRVRLLCGINGAASTFLCAWKAELFKTEDEKLKFCVLTKLRSNYILCSRDKCLLTTFGFITTDIISHHEF